MVSGETFALKAQLTDLLAMCGTSSGSIVPAFMALAYRIVWAEIKSATRVKSLSDRFKRGKCRGGLIPFQTRWRDSPFKLVGGIDNLTVELFASIFHSFKARNSNAITTFKWQKNIYIYKTIGIIKKYLIIWTSSLVLWVWASLENPAPVWAGELQQGPYSRTSYDIS